MSNEQLLDWSQLWSEVAVQEQKPPSHRLYYDDEGFPLFYSMEDLPGNYIEITAEQFKESSSHVCVVDGKLTKLTRNVIKKLVAIKDPEGTLCCYDSAAIVVDALPGKYWKLRTYDAD